MMTILLIQFVAAGGAMSLRVDGRPDHDKRGAHGRPASAGSHLLVFVGVGVAPFWCPAGGSDFDYRLTYRPDESAYLVDSAPDVEDSRSEELWRGEGHAVEEEALLKPAQAERLLDGVRLSEHSAYAISVDGGGLDGETGVRRPAPVEPWGRPYRLVAAAAPGQAVGAPGPGRRVPVACAGRVGRPDVQGRQPGAGYRSLFAQIIRPSLLEAASSSPSSAS